ncbi:MAG TPA: hypothetical protein P5055_16540, partial [Candidatus Paceibacterota bacterium]|nr:hypothetical protein [Candidatus Paceibacterota bacterium]
PLQAQEIQITQFVNGWITWTNTDTAHDYDYAVEWLPNLNETNWLQGWDSSVTPIDPTMPMTKMVPTFYQVRAYPYLEPSTQADMLVLYSNAMVDAAVTLSAEVWPHLTTISESNTNLEWRINAAGVKQVKVASFMKYSTATNYYPPGEHLLSYGDQWITAYPELKYFCARYRGSDPLLRIKQVLGMPPTAANDTVVEFWVSPDYLFRPTPDPEIGDTTAELVDGRNAPLMSSSFRVSPYYVEWFNNTYITRNYGMTNGVFTGYPWTRLGYTYDWASTRPPHVGLSEFVIPSGTLYTQLGVQVPIEVVRVIDAATYGKQ